MGGAAPKAQNDELLRSAYANSLKIAASKQLATIAFPLLSGGVFKGRQSSVDVARVGVQQIVASAYAGVEVHMVAFGADVDAQAAIGQACAEAGAVAEGPVAPANP